MLAAGVISTTAQLVFEARLRIIYDGVHDLLIKYAPDVLILEDLYAEYTFPRTALLMAHARGVVSLAAEQCDVPVMSLAPAEVKRAVAFNGAASGPARDGAHPEPRGAAASEPRGGRARARVDRIVTRADRDARP